MHHIMCYLAVFFIFFSLSEFWNALKPVLNQTRKCQTRSSQGSPQHCLPHMHSTSAFASALRILDIAGTITGWQVQSRTHYMHHCSFGNDVVNTFVW